jgi:site-specific recombinase XerD
MQEAGAVVPVHLQEAHLPATSLPASIRAAGPAAGFAWEEFFQGHIRNQHTRTSYLRAVRRFLRWFEEKNVELPRITPGMVGQYFNDLPLSAPSKKLHLAAIRALFDVLVNRHVVVLNPAHHVRTERYSADEGKTPTITVELAKKLLASIKLESLLDYRDRAIIAVLIYTAARAGAVAKLRLRDFAPEAGQFALRFSEKGGKSRCIPCRHDLQKFLHDYLFVTGLDGAKGDAPLFRTLGKDGRFSERSVSGIDICRLVKRRLQAAGLPNNLSPHSFRSGTATDLLSQGISLEDVQTLLSHSDVRTTRLYDRRQRQVTRNIVERISV